MDVQSLLQEVLTVYSGESYGEPRFQQWVLLALRTAEPPALRLSAWGALEETAHKLVVPNPPAGAIQAWRRRQGDGEAREDTVLEAFDSSLKRGRVGKGSAESFLYRLAMHHLQGAEL